MLLVNFPIELECKPQHQSLCDIGGPQAECNIYCLGNSSTTREALGWNQPMLLAANKSRSCGCQGGHLSKYHIFAMDVVDSCAEELVLGTMKCPVDLA